MKIHLVRARRHRTSSPVEEIALRFSMRNFRPSLKTKWLVTWKRSRRRDESLNTRRNKRRKLKKEETKFNFNLTTKGQIEMERKERVREKGKC